MELTLVPSLHSRTGVDEVPSRGLVGCWYFCPFGGVTVSTGVNSASGRVSRLRNLVNPAEKQQTRTITRTLSLLNNQTRPLPSGRVRDLNGGVKINGLAPADVCRGGCEI